MDSLKLFYRGGAGPDDPEELGTGVFKNPTEQPKPKMGGARRRKSRKSKKSKKSRKSRRR